MAEKRTTIRSRVEIEAELAAARARLAANVAALINEVHPKAVAARTVDNAKAFAANKYSEAKRVVKDESGWRTDRIVAISAAVGGVAALVLVLRSLRRR